MNSSDENTSVSPRRICSPGRCERSGEEPDDQAIGSRISTNTAKRIQAISVEGIVAERYLASESDVARNSVEPISKRNALERPIIVPPGHVALEVGWRRARQRRSGDARNGLIVSGAERRMNGSTKRCSRPFRNRRNRDQVMRWRSARRVNSDLRNGPECTNYPNAAARAPRHAPPAVRTIVEPPRNIRYQKRGGAVIRGHPNLAEPME